MRFKLFIESHILPVRNGKLKISRLQWYIIFFHFVLSGQGTILIAVFKGPKNWFINYYEQKKRIIT